MGNRKCFYLVEGQCEEKLINALEECPALVVPGKVKKFNPIIIEYNYFACLYVVRVII